MANMTSDTGDTSSEAAPKNILFPIATVEEHRVGRSVHIFLDLKILVVADDSVLTRR